MENNPNIPEFMDTTKEFQNRKYFSQIHSLVVLKHTGVPLYYRNFSEIFSALDFDLLSSFLAALIQFSEKLISQTLSVLELGNFRLFFRNAEENVFVVITGNAVSGLLIQERLLKIIEGFYAHFPTEKCQEQDHICEDETLDREIDQIAHLDELSEENLKSDLKGIFQSQIEEGEILGGAIITFQGELLYNSLPAEDIHIALREIEIRAKSNIIAGSSGSKFIWQIPEKMIFSQAIKLPTKTSPVYCVLLFSGTTSLGMADYALESIVHELQK